LQRLLQQQQSRSGANALQSLIAQQPSASELQGLVSQQPNMSELQQQIAMAQSTGNVDALNQILSQARGGYQQVMGGQYGYTPEEVEMQRAKLRNQLDRSNMEQQRAIQARYGAAGLRGGTAVSSALKQNRDYADALSSGMADIGIGAAEARRADTRAAQQIAANLLGIGGTAAGAIGQLGTQQQQQLLSAAGQLAELRNQARTAGISGAAQLADFRNQARATGISGAAQLGQLEQGAYDTQVRGATALDELLQNQAQFNETQRLAGAQMNEAGRQFDVGIDATAQDQRNRLAATAAEAPYNQWKDRIGMAIAGLGGTAGAAVGADRNALETYGQRYQAAEDASRGWSNIASNAMDYYLRTRRTPTQTSAGTYRSGYYGPGY